MAKKKIKNKFDYLELMGADRDELVSFTLIDRKTMERLMIDGKVDVPKKKVDIPKDEQWNMKTLGSKLLLGIQNGDSIPKIADSFQEVIGANRASAVRNARTMTTSAECHGRMDSYENLAKQGVIQKKHWIATGDSRTRDTHLELDGQERDIDEAFSNGLMFPGDASGEPSEVWNCRCSIASKIVGFRKADGSVAKVADVNEPESAHEKQIKEEREKRGIAEEGRKEPESTETKKVNDVIVQGKEIIDTWTRREDKYDFAIEDAINAQGFDGLPQVVSEEEFERYVKEANNGQGFVAQRTYAAPDQETLDAYRDQLYNGRFYVDCSTGGAQYGQGMYCAADYSGVISDGISNEMNHYKALNDQRAREGAVQTAYAEMKMSDFDFKYKVTEEQFNAYIKYLQTDPVMPSAFRLSPEDRKIYDSIGRKANDELRQKIIKKADESTKHIKAYSYVETLTLSSDAKIIKYDDLLDLKAKKYLERRDLTDKVEWRGKTEEEYQQDLKKAREYANSIMRLNDGVFAVLMGYDAINAEGHGESGSYTVILNRTKMIIKEDKQ